MNYVNYNQRECNAPADCICCKKSAGIMVLSQKDVLKEINLHRMAFEQIFVQFFDIER